VPDQPSDAASAVDVWAIRPPTVDAAGADASEARAEIERQQRARRGRHTARTDWRLGGRTVRRWREALLAVALISLGAAVLIGSLVATVWDSPWAASAANVLLWIGMLVPIVWAFTKSRPIGLLRVRALDLLYGVVLGALLRTTQGWIDGLDGLPAAFPVLAIVDESLSLATLALDVIAPVVVAPVIEEFFFRAVILVSLYTVLRRPFGKLAAGIAAALASTAFFVLVHGISGAIGASGIVSLSLLGVVCALLVLLTGRIWGAVLVHAVYNASYVVMALAAISMG
jgi:membrane protease YdiL (CAAX protease family)